MTLFVHDAADADILRQVAWYAEQGLPGVARRFYQSSIATIDLLYTMPSAGAPKILVNPHLAGLRSWPVTGFSRFRVYYLSQVELVIVVRVLHDRRDLGVILEGYALDDS